MVFCVGIFIMGMSCSKSMNSDQPKTDQKLTGEWTWIQSTFGNSIINPAGTGIQKKLKMILHTSMLNSRFILHPCYQKRL
jgi:hypothetical protein